MLSKYQLETKIFCTFNLNETPEKSKNALKNRNIYSEAYIEIVWVLRAQSAILEASNAAVVNTAVIRRQNTYVLVQREFVSNNKTIRKENQIWGKILRFPDESVNIFGQNLRCQNFISWLSDLKALCNTNHPAKSILKKMHWFHIPPWLFRERIKCFHSMQLMKFRTKSSGQVWSQFWKTYCCQRTHGLFKDPEGLSC